MYKLLIEDDEGGKTVVPVIRDEITIGRKEGNTIRLTERNVSRRHGRLVRDNGRLYVEDVSARYGLKKNGKAINKREEFREGDVLIIGDYRLTLQSEKAPNVGPPKKAAAPPPAGASDFANVSTQITNIEDLKRGPREATAILPAMPAKIIVISSNFAGQEFPLSQPETVIGRGEDCHIIIDHRSISEKHAKIVREDNTTYKIVDLNSKNGVKVSGEDYRATHLKRGDVIELGHVKFRFVEAGENYVFTPQPASAASDESPQAAGGNNKMIGIVGGLIVVAIIAVGAVVFLGSGDKGSGTSPTGSDPLVAVAVADPSGTPTTPTPTAPAENDRLSDALARAKSDIADGNLQRAIGSLESARDFLSPSPAQQDEIDALLSKARNEQPFQRAYTAAQELLTARKFSEALTRLSSIPSHSLFQEKIAAEGLADSALQGVVAEADRALGRNEPEIARTLVEEALAFRSGYGPAEEMLKKIDERQRTVAVRQAPTETTRSNAPATSAAATTTKTQKTPPPDPAQAEELLRSARRKFGAGDPQGAISDCLEALRGGRRECHILLAMNYAQIGNKERACHHFAQELRSNPPNRARIETQMDDLGCAR
jgi:ABC transport system ATP-binding/permease protein